MPPITAKDDAVRTSNRKSRSETSVEWLGIPELAQMLGVSEDFIRSQVQQRKIPYYKVGKLIRFDPPRDHAVVEGATRGAAVLS